MGIAFCLAPSASIGAICGSPQFFAYSAPYALPVTFLELADRLGVPRARVNMHPKGSFFRLAWLPVDRFKVFAGHRFQGRVKLEGEDREVIQVPVSEGLALIAGTIRLEDDGSQTLVDAVAVLKRDGE